MLKRLTYILFTFILSNPITAFGQRDTIIHYSNYIIYISNQLARTDTLNYVDQNVLRQGKWIEYYSSYSQTKSMKSVKYKGSDSLWTHGWIFNDVGGKKYEYRIKTCGYYIDNKKQGLWTNSIYKNDINKELFYIDDMLQSPVTFYMDKRLWAVATYDKKKSKWLVKFFSKDGVKYTTSYLDNINFLMEAL